MRKTFLLTLFAGVFYTFSHIQSPAVNTSPNHSVVASVMNMHERTNHSLLTRSNFDNVVHSMYDSIGLADYNLGFEVFRSAMIGYYSLRKEGVLNDKELLTIINFGQPSTERRFYTIDLAARKVVYHTYVAHGRNTGQNLATSFSNIPHSNQSSLGFYVTAETYYGSKGYSLRLDGKEKSFNDKIRSRAVVMHGAEYVSEDWIKRYGRLGRSQGCPALPSHVNKAVINTIKGGTAIFTYYPDDTYLQTSRYLNAEILFKQLDKMPIQLVSAVRSS